MRILESGAFGELRLNANKEIKKAESLNKKKPEEVNVEEEVITENKIAFASILNDKSFEVNLEKVEQIKNEIASGEYEENVEEIAKEIIKGEQRGDFNLGFIDA